MISKFKITSLLIYKMRDTFYDYRTGKKVFRLRFSPIRPEIFHQNPQEKKTTLHKQHEHTYSAFVSFFI